MSNLLICLFQNDLFILQARPVTTLNSWTEYELTHEFDSAILSEEDTFLTKANIGEVMPGALTVLSQTTTAPLVALAMEKCAQIHLNRYKDRAFSYQHHHAFIEFTNVLILLLFCIFIYLKCHLLL